MAEASVIDSISEAADRDLPESTYVAAAAEAVRNYRENRTRSWYQNGADPNDASGNLAFQRLRQTWFTPKIHPKFRFRPEDKFYAIGSCFARGVEDALSKRDIAIESAAKEFTGFQSIKNESTGLGFTNKYNTFSILNELSWALDPSAVFPVESIAQLTATTWCDPHTNPSLELVNLEETLARRVLLQRVTKRIANCRAVIITLGLVEVWRDLQTGIFINNTPLRGMFAAHPDRYEFHVTGFAQNWANLEAIHELLARYGHPDFKIVVTVSPVPLTTTFSTMDVVIANTYSKSLLRALAHEWAAAHDNVDYFPSYEIVGNSDRAAVWERDLTHVTEAGFQHVTQLFLRSYLA